MPSISYAPDVQDAYIAIFRLGIPQKSWLRRIGVALGLAGGIIQVAFALIRPSQPPALRTA
ncbi:hypothetical protein ABIF65_002681 [Bradyrhizobium japonicum]|uniref:hypothetical protein n=1 Tax=Bradyrhizobium TaxID=374 RepID=UPI0003F767AA|nr:MULTISPECIES: hypothetical protein [Bradyrhizobium]MBR0883275.1 hypothetical protein [Bradyrhizobium liaoningense]MBR0946611.1 hypothetical protein [Bradyrhizobium liaoningense]MBR1000655.1 hypothetical protein [Bradyrhizobium liaoningense]MBR1032365.1 hypothetical protein [Bradyrhizobium liaoningense]MBR1066653.1 hypothetical protein [Bradyrhizobium liaoningense]